MCDVTNPSQPEPAYTNTMAKLYGDRIAGCHGYRYACYCDHQCHRADDSAEWIVGNTSACISPAQSDDHKADVVFICFWI